jgi:hypothetical protein
MRESDIKHENGDFWVCDNRTQYTVYRTGLTHSVADSSYAHNENGLSIAIARCDYLATRSKRAKNADAMPVYKV